MNNAKQPPYVPVPLDLIGGLYTEATPETLPLGASPLVLNCDFILGSNLQRPGKQNAYYFANNFVEKLTSFAQTLPGAAAPNEAAWASPTKVTQNVPGSYSTVSLNVPLHSIGGQISFFDQAAVNNGSGGLISVSGSPKGGGEVALVQSCASVPGAGGLAPTPGAGWTALDIVNIANQGSLYTKFLPDASQVNVSEGLNASNDWASILAFCGSSTGIAPTVVQTLPIIAGGLVTPHNYSGVFVGNVAAGNAIIVACYFFVVGPALSVMSVTDSLGNTYEALGNTSHQSGTGAQVLLWMASSIAAGPCTVTAHLGDGTLSGNIIAYEIAGLGSVAATPGVSQILRSSNFNFNIPTTQKILGAQVEISGHQSAQTADELLKVNLVQSGVEGTANILAQLALVDQQAVVGTPLTKWTFDTQLIPSFVNNPTFGVDIVALASTLVTFSLYAVKLKLWLTPIIPPNFNYIKTFSETGGEVLTLALGSDGIIYQEDVLNLQGALVPVYTAIEPNSFAQSATVNDREFIAISNLQNGTDIPYTYTPPNFDRLSQVGPGAPPAVSTTAAGSTIASITQNPKVNIPTSGGGTSGSWIVWSDSPQDHGSFGTPATPGNIMTWAFPRSFILPSYIKVGSNIVISGVQSMNGYNPNNGAGNNPAFYTITSVGQPIPGQDYYNGFTITLPQTGFFNQRFQAGSAFQATIATMTTTVQIPNLEVGNQFQLSGTGGAPPAGYDNTWTVIDTPNASQLQITSTSLTNNIATYGFNLITGAAPVAGQAVTVTQTLNGNGVFNVSHAIIANATPGNFTLNLVGPNISSSAETGAGIIFGTIFTFDAFQIIGTKVGGSIVTVGVIASGIRKVCYSFLTRNGFISQPSPIQTADITVGAAGIVIANLLTGPSNVIARIIHLTAANGGNFYNIPQPVMVNSNGTNVISTSTWVNDNITTTVVLSFSDGVLLAADQIDIEGNNLFECVELGSCVALVPYAQRLFAVGEQNKITNLLNYSFDGGIAVTVGNVSGGGGTGSVNTTYPAGWTVDITNGAGGSVVLSPIFGNAYSIFNQSGITQAIYGLITQGAFQDEFQVAIINPSTTYSVRVTASAPLGASGGNLVIDLFSPKFGKSLGTFTLPLISLGVNMNIFTGTLLTTTLAPVPNDLVIRIYTTNIPNGVQVLLDRVEPFPTEAPNLNNQIIGSYQNNFESFDRLTGVILTNQQNQEPNKSAFVLFGTLYVVKSGSMVATNDNNTTEPNNWNIPRVVSQSVGTTGPYGVTTAIDQANAGEEWSLIGGIAGLFLFQGSQPVKLSEEIQSVWNQINWFYGFTLWITNDVANRRILVGVPLKALNALGKTPFWLPAGLLTDNNPTTPNVVLELNYKQLNTAGALMESVQIHRSYSGKLIASDIVRKWSIWTIKAPCAAFLTRNDTTSPLFLGNSDSTGKIYELIDGLMQDDGLAILQLYATAGFVPSETGEAKQMGVTRYIFHYMTLTIDGNGLFTITVYPNALDSPYSRVLLPNLTLPLNINGDVEVPVGDDSGSRMFVIFQTNAVGAGYQLSRVVMVMRQDPWAPVRGRND